MKQRVFATIILVEIAIITFLLYFLYQDARIKKGYKKEEIKSALSEFNSSYAPHPYLGYVLDYGTDPSSNKLGFMGEEMPLNKNENDYVVGIFGGSVARWYYKYEKNNLQKKISALIKDKNVKIYSFALSGYKQPQQLLTLQYLLSLGYKPDLVINIDGFNEAALSYSENYKEGVSTYFPRSWNLYSRQFFDEKTVSLINTIENLKSRRDFFSHLPFGLGHLPTMITDRLYNKNQIALQNKLTALDGQYQSKGPEPYHLKKEEDIQENIVNVWANSSLQMARLAKSNDIQYLEFLQPNQYVPNSKRFTQEEIEKYIHMNSPYAVAAKEIYPKIIERTEELRRNGVSIFDLTNLFINEKDTIYIDDCCHYNNRGYSLMTEDMIETIRTNTLPF